MQLGISTHSLPWSIGVPGYPAPDTPLTSLGLLRKAGDHDVRVVQLADNMAPHRLGSDERAQIRTEASERNIEVELGTRGTDPGHLLTYLSLAGQLQAKLVRTLITVPDIETACRELREVLPHFESAGISLAIENHGLHTTAQLVRLFETLHSPSLGCCLDTVNSFSALETPDTVVNRLGPYTINFHVKDFTIERMSHQMGFEITGTPAGDGRLDIPSILDVLRSYHREPNVILELWTPFTNTVDETVQLENRWFAESLQYLKTVL